MSTAAFPRRSARRSRSAGPAGSGGGSGLRTRTAGAWGRGETQPTDPGPAAEQQRGGPFGNDGRVTAIPRRAMSRTAKRAALPLGCAGRTVLGVGKRVTGLASEVFSAEIQQRTAEQLFSVLGQLKGGAMKF